jgi:hypothetical protein
MLSTIIYLIIYMSYIIYDNYAIHFILLAIITRYIFALYGPITAWSLKAGPRRVRQPL